MNSPTARSAARVQVLPEPPRGWTHLPFFRTRWPAIRDWLATAPEPWCPAPENLFRALALTPPESVRVVILGQDPYATGDRATGLAFGYPPGLPPSQSLGNVLRALNADLGGARQSGELSDWAAQGVLLLNSVMSVPVGEPGGHARLGWQTLAQEVLADVARSRPTAFLLWGAQAAQVFDRAVTDTAPHLVLKSSHPSGLSARRPMGPYPAFIDARPFSAVNAWLGRNGCASVDWLGAQAADR